MSVQFLIISLSLLRCHPQQPTYDIAGNPLTMSVKWGRRSCLHFFLPSQYSPSLGRPILIAKPRLMQPPIVVQCQQALFNTNHFLPQTTVALNMMRLYHTVMTNVTTSSSYTSTHSGSRLRSVASTSTNHTGWLYIVTYSGTSLLWTHLEPQEVS